MIRTVAIVGAGFAGLSTAKLLRDHGYDVTVFEKEPDVGGVWAASRRYPGLTTQNPRDTYNLSDFPMPRDYPEWPTGAQVQAYFESYVAHFKLGSMLKLETPVTLAEPLNGGEAGWRITALEEGREKDYSFDFLIVCNGIFSEPSIPDYRGASAFQKAGGVICHTSQFTELALAKDKHVLVIGYGKSSCDAAYATVGTAASTRVIARKVIWKLPRKLAGFLNYKHLMLTRMSEGLFEYIRLRGFDKFLHGSGTWLRKAMLGGVEAVVELQLKLEDRGLHPGNSFETIARSTVSLVTEGFYEAVGRGDIIVHKGAEIVDLKNGQAELSTGEMVPADVIVAGTGWNQVVPFLPGHVMAKVLDGEGNFRLYNSMLPLHVPRLAFNGYNSSFFSQLNCEVGAFWLLSYLKGDVPIPTTEEAEAAIDARLAWMKKRTDAKHSKGTNIIPFSVHQIDELLDEIDLNVSKGTKFKQWLMAVDPRDYAPIYDMLAKRYPAAQSHN
ncbi:MAG: NAD(P)/FAD-dependent oxidoreductase [Pseudomonadota bacterium]